MQRRQEKDELHKTRRARNDPKNRDFVCECGKSYLSYPAMYTHIKQKHEGITPKNITKPKNQISDTTIRGRPKTSTVQNQNLAVATPNDYQNNQGIKAIFEESDISNEANLHLKVEDFQVINTYFSEMLEGKLKEMELVDEIYEINCNMGMLNELTVYVCLLRKALNEKGWEVIKETTSDKEFCDQNNGRDLLKISNHFVSELLQKYIDENPNLKKIKLFDTNQNHLIKITQYFGSWLFAKRFTNWKLQLTENESDNDLSL